jgi:hypothetical protein
MLDQNITPPTAADRPSTGSACYDARPPQPDSAAAGRGTAAPYHLPTDVDEQFEAWGANCGPAALAALLGVNVARVRDACQPFPGYTNFASMLRAIQRLGVEAAVLRKDFKLHNLPLDSRRWHGRMSLIQWGGSWMKPGVHPGAALARTHWVAVRHEGEVVYDVNADYWLSIPQWEQFAKVIMAEVPRCDGTWSIRGSIIVRSPLPAVPIPSALPRPARSPSPSPRGDSPTPAAPAGGGGGAC